MCRRVDCSKCGRPTYAGCGAHVEQVLARVPKEERCRCRENAPESETPLQQRTAPGCWIKDLFLRR
jgi:hypothetical protein